ncbi:N-formylglutamate amidohydrolase [Variovorax sp. J22P240]|uniref:N-formylglutamate amidohydrolase n=1 Tax=Variovorax sp. J22P240 TaxID=3053514 RepID=UPI0025790F1E|nr:N-formylglutamate amidohydrolase [Variovorax sp. J22P240]MDM0001182.1 N-formylglutamate amidohydrolase [Variovorax sp. J22P240]
MWQIDFNATNLVARHRGTLPVLITCPHGGVADVPGVPLPRSGREGCLFEPSRDVDTNLIAAGAAQRVLEIFGEAPYAVIAEFHRKFIDANRSRECGFEVDAAAPFYDEYHDTVRAFVDEIRADNGGLGLLFDIHGTGGIPSDPAQIFLGTARDEEDGIARLRAADPQVLARRRSLRGFLEGAGYRVSPPDPNGTEVPQFNGGFTIRTYGSSHPDGLDAMQLEITRPLRTDPLERGRLIEVLAFAFGNLVSRYADSHTLSTALLSRFGAFGS